MSLLLQLLLLGAIGPQEGALPPLNQAIVAHVLTLEGKKVDRGECWDLAAAALNKAGAKWDGAYGFGRPLDLKQETLLPGDIIQFEGVQTEHRTPEAIERSSFAHHTAVILEVVSPEELFIAHQNYGPTGRKVSRYRLLLADVVKGRLLFYRPEA